MYTATQSGTSVLEIERRDRDAGEYGTENWTDDRKRRVPASVDARGATFDDGLRVRQIPFHPRPSAPLDDHAQQALEET